jgi:hypothetical protein
MAMMNKSDFPKLINGITYQSLEELDNRKKSDSEQLAQLLLDIYRKKKWKEEQINSK